MRTFLKQAQRDFIILNLTDIHMDNGKLTEGHPFLEILHRTADELVERVKPDLITITGDLAWGGHAEGQKHLIAMMDSYGIPWAPVFGNHDHDAGDEALAEFEHRLADSPYCIYEPGDPAYGQGNYTVLIADGDSAQPIEGLIFMDSHQNVPYVNGKGETVSAWAKLWDNQLDWFRETAEDFRKMGCTETALFQHIPPYGYRQAWNAAFRSDLNPKELPAPYGRTDCWNPGYEGSSGVHHEGVGCYPEEDGVLDVISGTGCTKYVFCGHEHINNWKIYYRGVNLVYTLKTGCGAYWEPAMNGGTIIRVGEQGISSVEHTYVAIPDELCGQV